MQGDYSRIWPFVIAALAVLLIYRRLRRNFGRQPFRPVRMSVRVAMLALLGCVLLPVAFRSWQFLLAEAAGVLAGTALGVWGASRTRFQRSDGRLYYVPHTYTGIAVSLLLFGRLVYRFFQMYALKRAAGAGGDAIPDGFTNAQTLKSPLTVALLAVLVGYYLVYFGWLLYKSRRLGPDDLETAPTAA